MDDSYSNQRMTVSDQQSGQLCTPSKSSMSEPATFEALASAVSPCLALVGGVGMNMEARTEWLLAAHVALDGIPEDLIKRGARAAMLKADHPSKIIPAIMAEIEGALELRRASARYVRPQPALPAPIETEQEKAERLELAELMGGLARKIGANAK